MLDREKIIEDIKYICAEIPLRIEHLHLLLKNIKDGFYDIKEEDKKYLMNFKQLSNEIADLKNTVKCSQHDIFTQDKKIQGLRKEISRVEELVMDEAIKNSELVTIFGKIGDILNVE